MRRTVWVVLGVALLTLSGCAFLNPDPQVLYHETFSGETGSQWAQSEDEDYKRWVADGRYYFEFKTSEAKVRSVQNLQLDPFGNFRLDVEITHISGQDNLCSAGVLFRIVDWDNYYIFRIAPTGMYYIVKYVAGEWNELVTWTSSPDIRKGAVTNTVTVRADGATLDFLVNGQSVHHLVDSSHSSGRIGVYVRTWDGVTNARMAFESILVTELE